MVRIVVHRERYLGIRAVDRTRRGEYQVPNAPLAAAFEDIYKARQVALSVGVGVLERIAHARLGGQVHHYLWTLVGKDLGYALTVSQVQPVKAQARPLAEKPPQASLL